MSIKRTFILVTSDYAERVKAKNLILAVALFSVNVVTGTPVWAWDSATSKWTRFEAGNDPKPVDGGGIPFLELME